LSLEPLLSLLSFNISGHQRSIRKDWWEQLEGHELVEPSFACDGCSLSPDYWRGYALWAACLIHDRHYEPDSPLGGNWAGRWEADAILRRNLQKLLQLQGMNAASAASVAWIFWSRVRLHGSGAYFFAPGEHDVTRWSRVREVYGLFTDKRRSKGVQPGFPIRRALLAEARAWGGDDAQFLALMETKAGPALAARLRFEKKEHASG
jgi:hypothetical protein